MSEYNFPIGAEVIRPGMPICTYLGDGRCESPDRGKWIMVSSDWELAHPGVLPEPQGETSPTYPVQPEPAHESDWSYAEAERLQKLAHDAIDAYNEYINAKPNTVFLTIFK